ncbi:hypothetical protein FISHEDRAFT_60824 [Fistulina hepatica ATCC 64428]|uniref:Uncharacterized protein n=1 Tax=Fistulina hepatica ATCC 64428 TaxID=1128425 RepID=A0A0D7A4P4_9AGAR|nr:hypothetical protein FISHEDRAFT_60824 [Fistulina hepatica ATCC 64428]
MAAVSSEIAADYNTQRRRDDFARSRRNSGSVTRSRVAIVGPVTVNKHQNARWSSQKRRIMYTTEYKISGRRTRVGPDQGYTYKVFAGMAKVRKDAGRRAEEDEACQRMIRKFNAGQCKAERNEPDKSNKPEDESSTRHVRKNATKGDDDDGVTYSVASRHQARMEQELGYNRGRTNSSDLALGVAKACLVAAHDLTWQQKTWDTNARESNRIEQTKSPA